MVNILLGCTGSVAAIKIPILAKQIIEEIQLNEPGKVEVCVIATQCSKHFFTKEDLPKTVQLLADEDEWAAWSKRGDPVKHIDLGKWADIFIIAPLSANTLAKIANGICDNLLTCIARAWDIQKPLLFCPAMNTRMYFHPLTSQQILVLQSWGYKLVPVVEKTLMCGDIGLGAMAEVSTIIDCIKNCLKST